MVPAGGGRAGAHATSPPRTPGLGGREPRAEPPPFAFPAHSLALTAGRRVERRPRVGVRTHIPGVSALGCSGQSGRCWRREERCPSLSLRTGTGGQRPRLSGNAAADADPARGAGRSWGGDVRRQGRQETRCRGAQGSEVRAWSLSRSVLRPKPPGVGSPSPVPAPSTASTTRYPGAGGVPAPPAWLTSPWNFSEERLLRKEAKRAKMQGGRGEGAKVRVRGPGSQSVSPAPPQPPAARGSCPLRTPRTPTSSRSQPQAPHPGQDVALSLRPRPERLTCAA